MISEKWIQKDRKWCDHDVFGSYAFDYQLRQMEKDFMTVGDLAQVEMRY
jgi:hypothetical protein